MVLKHPFTLMPPIEPEADWRHARQDGDGPVCGAEQADGFTCTIKRGIEHTVHEAGATRAGDAVVVAAFFYEGVPSE